MAHQLFTEKPLRELKNSFNSFSDQLTSKKTKPNNITVGSLGEQIASEYLQSKNYSLIAKNWKCKIGELDLIFEHDRTIVVVEVKSRIESKYSSKNIFLNITDKKQRKLKILTQIFLFEHLKNYPNKKSFNLRIDTIGVIISSFDAKNAKINHIIGAVGD